MKTLILLASLIIATSSYAFESEMCNEVSSWDKEKCEKIVKENSFEKIPVELCQYRVSGGEMLNCYKAIMNKTYVYDVILQCAALHHYDIPYCLEETGTLVE
ncbi:MAG: hypothetical protein KC478_07990 [Bacteriovoracaceae bacterium]|nr:hypothetical protein [Bacteriovoracaceae bacterium]